MGSGGGTLVLTAQRSASPQSAMATVLPAPAPQTITVTLPAQQQQQAQVTLQPSVQVSQPSLEPLHTASPCISPGISAAASTQASPQLVQHIPTTIKILGKLEDMKGKSVPPSYFVCEFLMLDVMAFIGVNLEVSV